MAAREERSWPEVENLGEGQACASRSAARGLALSLTDSAEASFAAVIASASRLAENSVAPRDRCCQCFALGGQIGRSLWSILPGKHRSASYVAAFLLAGPSKPLPLLVVCCRRILLGGRLGRSLSLIAGKSPGGCSSYFLQPCDHRCRHTTLGDHLCCYQQHCC